ncbi:MAG: hypothetical protein V7695_18470 [Sulfitobacter sp.]
MAKEKFERLKYFGPVSTFSIIGAADQDETPESEDRPLVTGVVYDDLPPDHPVIKNLIANKLLVPFVDEPTPEAPPKPALPDSDPDKDGDGGSGKQTDPKSKSKGAPK